MIHARGDYNRIQDPAVDDPSLLGEGSTPIAIDEPVVLFRSQDKYMEDVLIAYKAMVEADVHDGTWQGNVAEAFAITDSVEAHILRVQTWQAEHGCKQPDLSKGD